MAGRYKIKTVAERSGFSPTLLRAWERRYSFLQPERQPSGHRLYTDEDLKVLRAVKLLLDRGQSVGEVDALGREALLQFELGPPSAVPDIGGTPLGSGLTGNKAELLQAVARLDAPAARAIVRKLFTELSFEELSRFSLEVSQEIGDLWAAGRLSVASEHLLSSLWKEQLHLQIQQYSPTESEDRKILLAGFPDELHEVGLLFLHCELVRAGHDVVFLGAALPVEDLEAAIVRLRPHVVCLSVSRTPLLQIHLPRLTETVSRHNATSFVVGGTGVVGCEQDLVRAGVTPWSPGRSVCEAAERLFL